MEFVRRVNAQGSSTTGKEVSRNTLFEPVWKWNVQKKLIFHWDQFLETSIHFVSKMGQVTFVKGGWRKMKWVPFSAVSEKQELKFNSFIYPRRLNLSFLCWGLRTPNGRQDFCRWKVTKGHILPPVTKTFVREAFNIFFSQYVAQTKGCLHFFGVKIPCLCSRNF